MARCDSCGGRFSESQGRWFQRQTGTVSGAANGSFGWGGNSKSSRKRVGYSGERKIYKNYFECYGCSPLPTSEELNSITEQNIAFYRGCTKLAFYCFLLYQLYYLYQSPSVWYFNISHNAELYYNKTADINLSICLYIKQFFIDQYYHIAAWFK